MQEVWKDVTGFEGYYQISNLGRVKSLSRLVVRSGGANFKSKERILKPGEVGDGYYSVVFSVQGFQFDYYVHRLVANEFIPNPEHLPVVNHKDGNKRNNEVKNLEWASYKENNLHAFATGLCKYSDNNHMSIMCEKAAKSKRKPVVCINTSTKYDSLSNAAKLNNLDSGSVHYSIRTGRPVGTNKLIFKYI